MARMPAWSPSAARRLAASIVDDLQDPFRVSELGGDDLRERPGRLVEEAQAMCLLGGRRLVRVRDAGDLATVAVRDLLALPAQEGFVVLEAGELPGSSSLRKLVEDAATAAALPCYRDEARDLGGLVRSLLAEHRLTAEPEALSYLQTHLGGDRGGHPRRARQARPLSWPTGPVPGLRSRTPPPWSATARHLSVEDAINAALLGRRPELERALDRLLAEGEAPDAADRVPPPGPRCACCA